MQARRSVELCRALSMIIQAGKYTPVPTQRANTPTLSPFQILVRKARKRQSSLEWMHQELKEGRFLHRYTTRERGMAETRWRNVKRQVYGRKQNNKSEFRAVAHIPLRDFFRWRAVDPHFWEDDSNLRSLKRDIPDAAIYV